MFYLPSHSLAFVHILDFHAIWHVISLVENVRKVKTLKTLWTLLKSHLRSNQFDIDYLFCLHHAKDKNPTFVAFIFCSRFKLGNSVTYIFRLNSRTRGHLVYQIHIKRLKWYPWSVECKTLPCENKIIKINRIPTDDI